MDVNGTRFHLLLGERDWSTCSVAGGKELGELWAAPGDGDAPLEYDARRDDLILRRRLFEFVAGGARRMLTPADRRGAACDRYGNWYWVDPPRREILVASSGSGRTTRFWGPGDEVPLHGSGGEGRFGPTGPAGQVTALRLGGMAVTEDHYLVAGVGDPAGILVFDVQGGGAPELFSWPPDVAFAPFDLAARPGGGVFVLDADRRAYWELDRSFSVVPRGPAGPPPAHGFEPRSPRPPASGDEGETLRFRPPSEGDPAPLAASFGGDPVALTALPDATVLVLFHDPGTRKSVLGAFRDGVAMAPPAEVPDPGGTSFVPGHDLAALPADDGSGFSARVLVADRGGDQAFEYRLRLEPASLDLVLEPRYYPMRLFGGKGLVASGDGAYYDMDDRWIPLVEQPRQRYASAAALETRAFDGGEPGCVWHRLMLDACLTPETTVRVWSAAADDEQLLEDYPDWVAEPALYARGDGPELPWVEPDPSGRYRTWELLFQRAKGRFLRLKLELAGNERATPRVRALRAYYPRFSYLDRYLPDVYRRDDQSASFLDRYLANVEGLFTSVEDRIATMQVLLDPATAPGEALEWLGRWFDLAMDPAWSRPKQRLLLDHVMELFQWRGTVRGIRVALALVLEEEVDESLFGDRPADCALRVRIVERYRTKETPAVLLGDPTEATDREDARRDHADATERTAHRFRVLLPVSAKTRAMPELSGASDQQARLALARRIVDLEKPAHAVFDVKFYWDAFRVGEARLGLDTLVDLGGRSPNLAPPAVLGTSFVGEAVLASPSAATEATRRPLFGRRSS